MSRRRRPRRKEMPLPKDLIVLLWDVCAMTNTRKLPSRFWLLAAQYATYVMNRTPKIGRDKVRHEMLFGAKPSFKKILEFGTPVMFHNHDPAIKKMHDKAFEGMFVGFWEEDHTYKIFDTNNNKLINKNNQSLSKRFFGVRKQ